MLGVDMFFKPRDPRSGNMWDVWLYYHDGTYYLYTLCNDGKRWQCDNFTMARSSDGVNWTELGPVLTKDEGVEWMGTGSTWRNPVPGAEPPFQLNYSFWIGERQTIFFAQSDDLVHWIKCGKSSEFVQDERWYERNGRWDSIWTIERPGGGLYGYWTATPKKETGGQFGFGESLDGINWKALEPPKVVGVGIGEFGAVEKVGERYVALFGTNSHMVTLAANKPQGPFAVLTRNQVVLGGHTYYARFFQSPSGLLVCHHSIARDGEVYFGQLKGTDFDADGVLRLTWWPGNDALKHRQVQVVLPAGREGPIRMLGRKLDARTGFVLEGSLKLPEPLGAPCGLYIEHIKGLGTAILFNSNGRAELGPIRADGTGFKPDKNVDREMKFGAPARFKLLLKGPLLEIYLDDFVIECYSLPAPATGHIGLISGSKRSAISALKAWQTSLPSAKAFPACGTSKEG